jgi:hypothetical protein
MNSNGSIANSGPGQRIMFQLNPLIIALGIGFACGYGVRELISRRRRAAAREKFLRKQEVKREQKRYDESNGDVWLPKAPRISE